MSLNLPRPVLAQWTWPHCTRPQALPEDSLSEYDRAKRESIIRDTVDEANPTLITYYSIHPIKYQRSLVLLTFRWGPNAIIQSDGKGASAIVNNSMTFADQGRYSRSDWHWNWLDSSYRAWIADFVLWLQTSILSGRRWRGCRIQIMTTSARLAAVALDLGSKCGCDLDHPRQVVDTKVDNQEQATSGTRADTDQRWSKPVSSTASGLKARRNLMRIVSRSTTNVFLGNGPNQLIPFSCWQVVVTVPIGRLLAVLNEPVARQFHL